VAVLLLASPFPYYRSTFGEEEEGKKVSVINRALVARKISVQRF
jgi:hypothetical protein